MGGTGIKTTKSFTISKGNVVSAYKAVKRNNGSAGIDNVSMEDFEKDLKNNLYRIWNRMSSGSYFPPSVLIVDIPKKDGKTRRLGIPSVGDRIAQTVVKMELEPELESVFHTDSYGYRPGKSAHDAVRKARENCWKNNWVIDMDIKGFFDNIDHDLMMKAVKHHTDKKWVSLYIERWLKVPAENRTGLKIERTMGTPQGGVISPLLANLYLHYALDMWLDRNFSHISFERYADDVVIHCRTEKQAEFIKDQIRKRMGKCKLELHPEKTKIVYCKDNKRKKDYENTKFDFLGFTFRPRVAKNKYGELFVSFSPAISRVSAQGIKNRIRSWKLHRLIRKDLEYFAKDLNSVLRGWINYYGIFNRSALVPIFSVLNWALIKWIIQKFKGVKRSKTRAMRRLQKICQSRPEMFAHWKIAPIYVAG